MSATLHDIQTECDSYGCLEPEYHQKMMHRVPEATVVNRADFLTGKCRGRRVLSFGATGPMQERIDEVASESYGTDLLPVSEKERQRKAGFRVVDLDHSDLAHWDVDVDVVICGEVIEHLTNPGRLLRSLKKYNCEVVITVPNAHSACGDAYAKKGIECVNVDHVAWYSYCTLKQLVERTGYEIVEWHWYNGKPLTAEGLIFVVK